MFRIGSQSAPQPAQAVTGSTAAQPAPAPNSLEGLLKSLEDAIQRLQHQQGGPQPGGGDRMEPARQPPAHRHHHHHRPGQQPAPTAPGTGPVQTAPTLPPNQGPVRTAPTLPPSQGPVRTAPTLPPNQGPIQTAPTVPTNKGPVVISPNFPGSGDGPIVVKLPNGGDLPEQAQDAQSGGYVGKGLAGGTVGT